MDQWAAEAVLDLRAANPNVSLDVIVPFRGQADRFTPAQRKRYKASLKRADRVTIMQEDYSDDCFFRRNDYLIEHSQVLIAVYDRESKARSGTGYTVHKAMNLQRNIIFIHPKTLEISYHVGNK